MSQRDRDRSLGPFSWVNVSLAGHCIGASPSIFPTSPTEASGRGQLGFKYDNLCGLADWDSKATGQNGRKASLRWRVVKMKWLILLESPLVDWLTMGIDWRMH